MATSSDAAGSSVRMDDTATARDYVRFDGATDATIVHRILAGMERAGLEGLVIFFEPIHFSKSAKGRSLHVRIVRCGTTLSALADNPVFRSLLRQTLDGSLPTEGTTYGHGSARRNGCAARRHLTYSTWTHSSCSSDAAFKAFKAKFDAEGKAQSRTVPT